jgi:hypothetical protein
MAGYWEALFPGEIPGAAEKVLMLPARAVRPEAREDCGDDAVRSACAAAVPELRGAAGACRDHRGARLGGGVLLSRPGQQDAGLDLHPLFQGEARQGLDLGLATAEVALIAFLGQEQEAFEVAAPVVDDAVDLPGGLVAAFAAAVVAAGLVWRAFCAPGRGLDRTVLEYVPTTYGTQDDGKPETD